MRNRHIHVLSKAIYGAKGIGTVKPSMPTYLSLPLFPFLQKNVSTQCEPTLLKRALIFHPPSYQQFLIFYQICLNYLYDRFLLVAVGIPANSFHCYFYEQSQISDFFVHCSMLSAGRLRRGCFRTFLLLLFHKINVLTMYESIALLIQIFRG